MAERQPSNRGSDVPAVPLGSAEPQPVAENGELQLSSTQMIAVQLMTAAAPPAPSPEPPPPPRLMSLDAFRGLAILGMLLVNNAALDTATPPQFTHAPWNGGVRFADLVFPWFLFIVGVAIPYSAASHRRKLLPEWLYDIRVIKRAALLVLLGCLIDSSIAKRPLFDLGVLQLIGLAYLVGAFLYDLPLSRRMIVAGGLLIGHWAAIRFLPIPGVGVGVITESKNLINHINQVYLDTYHLGGLISVVPTGALVLIGTAIGDVLRRDYGDEAQRISRLLLTGVAITAIGWLWSHDLPFNKSLWTASYILYTSGLGTLLLTLFYMATDVNGWRWWALPLAVFGANAIFIYVVPILVKLYILQVWTWHPAGGAALTLQDALLGSCVHRFGRVPGGWIYTAGYVVVWWLAAFQLYRKKVFLRV